MQLARAFDVLDRRALALLRFVDALGRTVRAPVSIAADGVRWFAKRPGEIVITDAPGFGTYAASFAPTAAPAAATIALDLRPADAALGARRFNLVLPRNADPADAGDADSLFQPVIVPLLPTPRAQPTGLAAALFVTVRRADDQRLVEGALVRLRPDGGRPAALALTDAAGEALLLVGGVPLSTPGQNATVRPDLGGQLDAFVDPAVARFHADADLAAARTAAAARTGDLVDPDALAGGQVTPAQAVRIEAGRNRTAAIAWSP